MVGLADLLGGILDAADARHPNHFPSVIRGSTLCIAADFSGQNKGQNYEVYSFLVFDLDRSAHWAKLRADLRTSIDLRKRRMSFKALNDVQRRKALVPFLNIADMLNGSLVSFAVSKNQQSLFEGDLSHPPKELLLWKSKVCEKVLRVSHFLALLSSRYSVPSQNLMVFIDEDDIAANDAQLTSFTKVVSNISSHYLRHGLGHLRVGTSRSENGDLILEDLLAIPDLAAGAIAEISRRMSHAEYLPRPNLIVPLPETVSTKAKLVGLWLSDARANLKKELIFLDLQDDGKKMKASHVKFQQMM